MSGLKKSLLILFSVIVVIIITLAFLFKFNVIKFKEEKKEEEPTKVEEKLKYYFYDNTLTSYTTNDNSLESVITYECKTEECYSLVNNKYYIVYDEGKLNFWSFKKEDISSKLSYEVKTFIVDNETIKLYLFSNNSIYIIKDNEIINDETFILKDCDISDTLLLYKKTAEGYKLYFIDLLNENVKYSEIMNEIVNSNVFSYEENFLYLEQSINSIYKRIYIFDKNYKYLGTSDKYYNKRINENNNFEFIDL